ncbi:MAG: hypothetical protein QM690_05585 [Sphingobium sp.]
MDASLSAYIEFQYAGARDVLSAFFTVASGALAISWLFAKDFLSILQTRDRKLARHVMGGIGSIGLAAFFAGHALAENYILTAKAQRLLHVGKPDRQRVLEILADAHRAFGLSVLIYGALMAIGLFMLLAKATEMRGGGRSKRIIGSPGGYRRMRRDGKAR